MKSLEVHPPFVLRYFDSNLQHDQRRLEPALMKAVSRLHFVPQLLVSGPFGSASSGFRPASISPVVARFPSVAFT